MKLKTFANIDLSTPEARKEIIKYLTDLQCDHNICENTPDEIIACANGMLSVLISLADKYRYLIYNYYPDNRKDKGYLLDAAINQHKSVAVFYTKELEDFSRITKFGSGADFFIPEISKIAPRLRDVIAGFTLFNVKVVDYAVLLVI